MRLTVLGGCGAWPEAGQACSGFLVEQDGFRLLVDAGYATLPRLLHLVSAAQLDAVYISHGHPDHCADLNPLLRARALGGEPRRRCRCTRRRARSTRCWPWTAGHAAITYA